MANLKPQDIYVLLKLVSNRSRHATYAQLAADLGMSASEVHACLRRAASCQLLHGWRAPARPNLTALEEFLVHGLKYTFPAELGAPTRGYPTAYAAEPLRRLIASGADPIPVWPSPEGTHRGFAFAPLYKSAPMGALRDPCLYELLALVDSLRSGRPRERKLAEEALHQRLLHDESPPSVSG